MAFARMRGAGAPTVAFDFQHDPWRQDLVPPVDHPDHPARINVSYQWHRNVREAGNAAEWVPEACVGEKVGVESMLLVGWRAFCEEMDDAGRLFL